MSNPNQLNATNGLASGAVDQPPVTSSAVSWSAVLAGAAAAAALSLILLILGAGLGLSSVSPWPGSGMSATTLGIWSILWVTFTQLVAAGMGGYLAGRLRVRWVGVHPDEVYFRDTAHGFLAWAIASLAAATLLASVIGAIVSGGIQAGASMARGGSATTAMAAQGAVAEKARSEWAKPDADSEPLGYFVDSLFRKDTGGAGAASAGSEPGSGVAAERVTAASRSEVTRIYANAIWSGTLPAEDVPYVGQMVAQRTGITQRDAERRVTDAYARMQASLRAVETSASDAADKARKASAYASLWLFIALLSGAFVASFAATYGGRQRDL